MFPTTATVRAAKRDRVAGGQQQLHTGNVMSDCYNSPYHEAVSSIRNLMTRHGVVTRDPLNMEFFHKGTEIKQK
jgi:hypothetical protein